MTAIPKFGSYGEYASGNYGAHAMMFTLPNGIEFYYSYTTLVAFRSGFSGLVVMKNYWSTTTGKHLNWIDGGNKKQRIERDEFDTRLHQMLSWYRISEHSQPHEQEEARRLGKSE